MFSFTNLQFQLFGLRKLSFFLCSTWLYKDIYFVLTHKTSNSQLMADSINILLQYETLKAWLNFPASELVYNSYRDLINEEFDKEQQNFVVY